MALSIITATSSSWISGVISWSTLGFALLTIGIIATLLSSQRYLLGYLFGGMGYWLLIEGLQSVVINTVNMGVWHSYVTALVITWIIPSAILTYHYAKMPVNLASLKSGKASFYKHGSKVATDCEKYIEHTPIYKDYTPRFHN